ncbi:NUDIX hydrolase [Actinomycetospora soli]|uniref:NUDIX hydrolase n=1 Tax=Actinomycetospora soli TaxID=2893887 RepID=UPI001E53085F|nr:NUDIX domain-containing protein [Actinomycetospora soli]MCD2188329.1 NUDIX domain-containing protein [Actinomycetospora soli]
MNLFGPGGWVLVVVIAVVIVLLLVTALVAIGRARRLDRLHVRVDAARLGLVAALDRRAAVVRAVAATAPPSALSPTDRRALRAAARAAEAAGDGAGREAAENDLVGRRGPLETATLPPDLSAELADADARVVVARRIHNDAVRDTRALRGRRMVRALRLAGTAPYPEYFEIAEPVADTPGPDEAEGPAVARDAARVVVLDPDERVLLFEGVDPARPTETFWFTPGGGIEPGEEPARAAARELHEETGVAVGGTDELAGPVWVRDVLFSHDGVAYAARELFFLLRVDPTPEIDVSGFTELERRTVRRHRWWTRTELAATVDVVYPRQLADLLGDPGSVDPADAPVPIQ